MTDFIRTPDTNFAHIADFPYTPNYHSWQDMRVHYVDEGPKDGPVMLLGLAITGEIVGHIRSQPGGTYNGAFRRLAHDRCDVGRAASIDWTTNCKHTSRNLGAAGGGTQPRTSFGGTKRR